MMFLLIILFFCPGLQALPHGLSDSRSAALGGTSILAGNASGAWLNPAQLCALTNVEADLSCEFLFLGLEAKLYTGENDYFDSIRFSLSVPFGPTRLGIGYYYFFSAYFSDSQLRLSVSETIGRISLGASVKYLAYDYEKNDYASINPDLSGRGLGVRNIGLDAGVRAEIMADTLYGSFSLIDINEPDMGLISEDKRAFHSLLEAGLVLRQFSFSAGIRYSVRDGFLPALGIESVIISPSFPVRLGFNNSFLPGFGFGVRIKNRPLLRIDYAAGLFSGPEGGLGSHYFTLSAGF